MIDSPQRIVRIFALGSPHGDDQVARVIADRLSEDPLIRSITYRLATPWDLVELLEPDCSVIVIDACVGVGGMAIAIVGRQCGGAVTACW